MHAETFKTLSRLSPIIEFTNYLMKKFNLKLKREDAKKLKVSNLFNDPEDGLNIKVLWENFKEAWNSLNLEFPLTYGYRFNTYTKYNEESSLNNFLVDNKEE